MSDPESTELLKAVAEGSAEGAARAVLEKLDPFIEGSAALGDVIRFIRWRIQLKILDKAKAILRDRGLEPQAVPLKVLVPLLEQASLEDPADEEMVTRWAALLANAAGGDQTTRILPSFPAILGELSSTEAWILDYLYRGPEPHFLNEEKLDLIQYEELKLEDRSTLDALLFNLARLDLCAVHSSRESLGRPLSPHFVEGTPLGAAFLEACTVPPGAHSGAQGQ